MANNRDNGYDDVIDETMQQEPTNKLSERLIHFISFWQSLDKNLLFGGILVLTIVCAICFGNLFFKILLIVEVLIAICYGLYKTYHSSLPQIIFNKLEDGFELIQAEEDGVKFNDLTVREPVNDLHDLFEYIINPKAFNMYGFVPERKVLFIGESGSGKNTVIKAFSNETGLPIIRVHASRFFIDDDLFTSLFKIAPYAEGYILQIDSFEMLNSSDIPNSSLVGDSIIDTLLRHLSVYENVILFATSEDPESLTSDEYIVSKCFKKVIHMPVPNLKERMELIRKFIGSFPLDSTVDFKLISQTYHAFSIGEIKYLVAIAKSIAHQNNRLSLTQEDFFNAMDSVLYGISDRKHSKESRKIVVYHEAGHALVQYLLSDSNDILRIISTSRGNAGGYTMVASNKEKVVVTKDELLNRICFCYGGRCAEQIVFNQISTGASQDIQSATNIILAMIRNYGMSDKIGAINVAPKLVLTSVLPESSNMQNMIAEECQRISHECEERTIKLLREHREKLDRLAEYLIEHESITGDDMVKLFKECE